jgi:hypothetical protein
MYLGHVEGARFGVGWQGACLNFNSIHVELDSGKTYEGTSDR